MRKAIPNTLLILLILIGAIFLAGCTKIEYKYICANGVEVMDKNNCKFNKVATVIKQEADGYARNFVNAYAMSQQGRAQYVSSYLGEDGNYMATFVFTAQDDTTYQTVVKVDGVTGQVECSEGCDYIGKKQT